MTTTTFEPETFSQAYQRIKPGAGYPKIGQTVCRTVHELANALGGDCVPADWEEYARLAAALTQESREAANGTASDARRGQHLVSDANDALSQSERLYARCVAETGRDNSSSAGYQQRGAASPPYKERSYGVGARIGQEERTYSEYSNRNSIGRDGAVSFFRDAFKYQQTGDVAARSRIERHAQEVERDGGLTERAVSTGGFAGLVVPQYLVAKAALVARAGRPFANSLSSEQIPPEGMTFHIPKATTGATVAVQSVENTSVSSTDEAWTDIVVQVGTVAGQQDVSRQTLFERGAPGNDMLIYADLAGAYGVAVDQQLISGSGSSGQTLGVLNTAGIGQATAYTAALGTSVQPFYGKLSGATATISGTRFLPPDHALLHPRRAAWLANQFDSAGRPLVLPGAQNPQNAAGTAGGGIGPIGSILNLDLISDASVPTSVGSGPEDLVIVYRADDLLFWEDGDGMPRELRFEQTLGQQLTIKLVSYNYVAFTAARYPQSVVVIGGNSASGMGQVTPTF